MSEAPVDVIALAEARKLAKATKDFALADHLREEISVLGWQIKDLPGSYELSPQPTFETFTSFDDVPETPTNARYLALIKVDGWLEDIKTCTDALHERAPEVAVLLVDVSGDTEIAEGVHHIASAHGFHEIHLTRDPGWGPVMRSASEKFHAENIILMDPSTVLLENPIPAIDATFANPGVVAVGWRGALVNIEDAWRTVDDKGPGEVDVLLGYFMAVRRKALLATEAPHTKALFYRNADLELSLELRAHGGRLVALDLPLAQGRHRGYHDSEPAMRERESKKNYDRILAKFRGRSEILSPRR
ncbi:MAG: hypothetical protein EBU43_07100 [Actinobacteria bacterium]|nr:hypothetical protein [Actinomycetota bacterium]